MLKLIGCLLAPVVAFVLLFFIVAWLSACAADVETVNESPNFTGTVDVTHLIGNNWQVHTCLTQ